MHALYFHYFAEIHKKSQPVNVTEHDCCLIHGAGKFHNNDGKATFDGLVTITINATAPDR